MEKTIEQPEQGVDRQTSVDSAAYFEEQDDYGEYDDFGINTGGGGGGGKTKKRQENRGGSGATNVYSTKHTRLKTAQRENQKTTTAKPASQAKK
jgi:hypothetical protein